MKIRRKGFKFNLSNNKLNSSLNLSLELTEEQIKKLEKDKNKGIGAQLHMSPSQFNQIAAFKVMNERFKEYLNDNCITAEEFYNYLSQKKKKNMKEDNNFITMICYKIQTSNNL